MLWLGLLALAPACIGRTIFYWVASCDIFVATIKLWLFMLLRLSIIVILFYSLLATRILIVAFIYLFCHAACVVMLDGRPPRAPRCERFCYVCLFIYLYICYLFLYWVIYLFIYLDCYLFNYLAILRDMYGPRISLCEPSALHLVILRFTDLLFIRITGRGVIQSLLPLGQSVRRYIM